MLKVFAYYKSNEKFLFEKTDFEKKIHHSIFRKLKFDLIIRKFFEIFEVFPTKYKIRKIFNEF